MTLPHPALLADIGGTYARFFLLPEPGGRPGTIWKVPTTGFPGPVDAIRAFLDRAGRGPAALGLPRTRGTHRPRGLRA